MKKEVFLAIAIGFALGLVITFGIWTANKSLKNLPKAIQPSPTPETASASPTPNSTSSTITLSLTTPADEALFTIAKTPVSGKTVANASVVIFSEDNQQIVTADAKGNFTADVALVGGYNTIRVIAYDAMGNSVEQTIIVTFTTAKI